MKVEMIMPQMGESIAEGTIVKWLKGVGDAVVMDEDILEISTDKVDSEIPSPATGKIAQILVKEGQTVAIKTLLAIIETEAVAAVAGTGAAAAPPPAPPASGGGKTAVASGGGTAASVHEHGDTVVAGRPAAQESSPHDGSAEGGFVVKEFRRHAEEAAAPPAGGAGVPAREPSGGSGGIPTREPAVAGTEARPTEKTSNFLSPLVQRIMSEEGVSTDEVNRLMGSGQGGRVTKKDVLDYVAQRKAQPEARALPPAPIPEAKVVGRPTPPPAPPASGGGIWVGPADEIVEMDRMRRAIADHMVRSVHTSPHVVSYSEVDMSRIVKHREGIKESFKAREGVNLTYTSYFIFCAAKALKEFPYVNASVDVYNIILRKQVNIGFAVELPTGGLIVPVIRNVDGLSLTGVAKGLNELAEKARANKLDPNDVSGGTFTVTNVGVFGNVAGAPIINQPQVAILGTGAIKKRPVVIETKDGDFIGIKPMMMTSLSYDHRIIDGAMAGRFMARLGQLLEGFEG